MKVRSLIRSVALSILLLGGTILNGVASETRYYHEHLQTFKFDNTLTKQLWFDHNVYKPETIYAVPDRSIIEAVPDRAIIYALPDRAVNDNRR